jgi:hypothetical protein
MSKREWKNKRAWRRSLWILLTVIVVTAGAAVVGAQEGDNELANLQAELSADFEILPLSDGWLLQPLAEDAGYQAVELEGSELVVDGVSVSADELRARLGDLAEPILRLSSMGAEQSEEEGESDVARDKKRKRRDRHDVHRSDAQVVVGSSVTIDEDEVARDVVVVGGSLSVHGLVKGDAVAIGGAVEVDGEVTGDVAAIGASVKLESGARIRGDAVSIGGSVEQHEDAVVEGTIQEVPFFPSLRFGGWSGSGARIKHGPDIDLDFSPSRGVFGFTWELFGIAVLAMFAALTLLVAKNPVERVGRQVADEPWKSGLVGLLSQILFAPLLVILVLVLVISIVGIPFLLLLPFLLIALLLIALLGYTAVALRLGRWSEERFGWKFASPFLALLVGIGLIEVWSLIGEILSAGPGPIKLFGFMFALFGGLLCYVVWTIGFGAAILSRFGTSTSWDGSASEAVASEAWETPLDSTFEVSDGAAPSDEFRDGESEAEGDDRWLDDSQGETPGNEDKS